MKLAASCHCGAVQFKFRTDTPVPYLYCYWKTQGGSGAVVNLKGSFTSLTVTRGLDKVRVYQAVMNPKAPKEEQKCAGNLRSFCGDCASYLWAYDSKHHPNFYPYASAVDFNDLPSAPKSEHIMLAYKPSWVMVPKDSEEHQIKCFQEYPEMGIQQWHEQNKLVEKD